MIKPIPWANSLALTSIIFYLALWVLSMIAPTLFTLVFNAQFLGANVASLNPAGPDLGSALVLLIVVGATTWVVGYVWAYLYNRLAKK